MVTIASVVECALYDLIDQASKKANFDVGERRDFLSLIRLAHEMNYIDTDTKNAFHELRKIRNLVHMTETEFQEYKAYSVDEANYYIRALDTFQNRMTCSI